MHNSKAVFTWAFSQGENPRGKNLPHPGAGIDSHAANEPIHCIDGMSVATDIGARLQNQQLWAVMTV